MAINEFERAFGVTEEDKKKYDQVGSEILRRDGNAEWREWRAYRLAGGLILAVIILAIGFAIFALRAQRVQVAVQVVLKDEAGRLIKIGVPQDLLDYQPDEGAYRDMLHEWVKKRHWRGEEKSDTRARDDWRWLYLHACGHARKQLDEAEKHEKPFTPSPKRVSVDIDSITKTMRPESYQVLWKATTTEQYNPKPDEQRWATTFTVGRVAPKTLSEANLNNLGLCVTGYDDDKRH